MALLLADQHKIWLFKGSVVHCGCVVAQFRASAEVWGVLGGKYPSSLSGKKADSGGGHQCPQAPSMRWVHERWIF